MVIKRDIYLEKLKEMIDIPLIKIISGLRRSGKSFLLFNLFKEYLINELKVDQNHIIEINLENQENHSYCDPNNFLEFIKSKIKDQKKYFLLIDEVQLLKDFVPVLNQLNNNQQLNVFVTGSNSKFLINDVVTEFRGRSISLHVFPLSFYEIASHKEFKNLDELWKSYLIYGGLPLIQNMKEANIKTNYLVNEFKRTYLIDIVEKNKIEDIDNLDDIINILASNIGSYTNPYKLSLTFKSIKKTNISDATIRKYIENLKNAFIINEVKKYDIKGKKYINDSYKYYFEDIGLRNAKINFAQNEENHLMENIIYNELLLRGYNVNVGIVEIRPNANQKVQLEVDFIAQKGNQKVYIQSCLNMYDQNKEIQEKRPFKNINDNFKKIIITKDDPIFDTDINGYKIYGIKQFLLDLDILNKN